MKAITSDLVRSQKAPKKKNHHLRVKDTGDLQTGYEKTYTLTTRAIICMLQLKNYTPITYFTNITFKEIPMNLPFLRISSLK